MKKNGHRGREVVTEAIILKTQTVHENDIWVDLLTPEEGRVWGVARHGRKSRKRFSTVLEIGNHLHVRFRDKGGVVFLEEAQMMPPAEGRGYPEQDLAAWLMAFFMIDLVREFVPERNADPAMYQLIQKSLQPIPFLKNREERLNVLEAFEKEFLKLCGYGVTFDYCTTCKKEVSTDSAFYFVYRQGAVYCRDCISGQGDAVVFDPHKLVQLIPRFLEYQLSRPLKSRKVLTSLEVFS